MMTGEYASYVALHWGMGLIGFLVFAIPGYMILRKAGFSGWWVIISLVPLLNIIIALGARLRPLAA